MSLASLSADVLPGVPAGSVADANVDVASRVAMTGTAFSLPVTGFSAACFFTISGLFRDDGFIRNSIFQPAIHSRWGFGGRVHIVQACSELIGFVQDSIFQSAIHSCSVFGRRSDVKSFFGRAGRSWHSSSIPATNS